MLLGVISNILGGANNRGCRFYWSAGSLNWQALHGSLRTTELKENFKANLKAQCGIFRGHIGIKWNRKYVCFWLEKVTKNKYLLMILVDIARIKSGTGDIRKRELISGGLLSEVINI